MYRVQSRELNALCHSIISEEQALIMWGKFVVMTTGRNDILTDIKRIERNKFIGLAYLPISKEKHA